MKKKEEELPGDGNFVPGEVEKLGVAETHNPPCTAKRYGIHVQVGEEGGYFHRDLEDVLAGLVDERTTSPGGVVRDIIGVGPADMVVHIGGITSRDGFGGEVRNISAPARQPIIDGAHNRPLIPLNIENNMAELVPGPSEEKKFLQKVFEEE